MPVLQFQSWSPAISQSRNHDGPSRRNPGRAFPFLEASMGEIYRVLVIEGIGGETIRFEETPSGGLRIESIDRLGEAEFYADIRADEMTSIEEFFCGRGGQA